MQPLLSWYLIARNEGSSTKTDYAPEGNLARCLASLKAFTPYAEIIVVEGGPSSDDTLEVARRYANRVETYLGPDGSWTKEMLAFDNAAAARNYALSLCTGKWAAWIDADDTIANPELAVKIAVANGESLQVEKSEGKVVPLAEMLEKCEQNNIEAVYAPYAYQWAEYDAAEMAIRDGKVGTTPLQNFVCDTWERSKLRIHRNNGQFEFARAAHESCSAKNPYQTLRTALFPNLIWVHHKKLDQAAKQYSLERHFKIIWQKYQEGKADFLDLSYLFGFGRAKPDIVSPETYVRILEKADALAATPLQKAMVAAVMGARSAEQGFWLDAEYHYGAAWNLMPGYPDPALDAARIYREHRMWRDSAKWYGRLFEGGYNSQYSLVPPHDYYVAAHREYAEVLVHLGDESRATGKPQEMIGWYKEASVVLDRFKSNPAVKGDGEATAFIHWVTNKVRTGFALGNVRDLFSLLMDNDEAEKAVGLLKCLPFPLEDTTVVWPLTERAKKIERHLTDPSAYAERYGTRTEEHSAFSDEKLLLNPLARIQSVVDYLERHIPQKGKVLEIGPFDGQVAVPVLRARPDLEYTAIEASPIAAQRLLENVERYCPGGNITVLQKAFTEDYQTAERYDAVICTEVIEHVQHPVEFMTALGRLLKPDGLIFLSTPLGSVDRGDFRVFETAQDREYGFREHVRALTVRNLHEIVGSAGMWIQDQVCLSCFHGPGQVAVIRNNNRQGEPISFVVPSAHFPWNASSVISGGIGASEETIVYLARELAKRGRKVEVYTQLPERFDLYEETNDGVAYWSLEQVHRIQPGSRVVVSRVPGYWHPAFDKAERVHLWLQDVCLGNEFANEAARKRFEKVVCVSEWHQKEDLVARTGYPVDRTVVIPNFLLKEHFPLDNWPERHPHRFIYASSPDRGLVTLLKLWPKILDLYPDAELHVCYGWAGMKRLAATNPAWVTRYRDTRMAWLELGGQKGIYNYERLNHQDLAALMRTCSVWAYFCSIFETDCNTARKMRAAGVVPVVPPMAGLKYSAACDWTQWLTDRTGIYDEGEVLAAIQAAVAVPESERRAMAAQAVEQGALEARIDQWIELLS